MTQTTADALEQLRSRIGQDTSPGDWLLITQDRVNQFADVTDDHQYIHVDPERAKNTPFGGTIAHGFLTLSLCLMLPRYRAGGSQQEAPADDERARGPRAKMSVNYGLNKVRFPSPVPVGSRIRGSTRLLSAEEVAPNVIQSVTQITVEVEGQNKPAAVVEMVGRHYY
jgi:acyl dehydratase